MADRESRFLLRDFFDALVAGAADNAALLAIARTPGVLETLLGPGAPLEEWRDARAGRAPRRLQPPAQRPPAAPPAPPGTRRRLQERLGGAVPLVAIGGEVHGDGWVGEAATLTFLPPAARGRIELRLFLPEQRRPREVMLRQEQGAAVTERSFRVAGGEMKTIAIACAGAASLLRLAIRVGGSEQVGADLRRLGVNLLAAGWVGEAVAG